jgi:hypothetical protein
MVFHAAAFVAVERVDEALMERVSRRNACHVRGRS